MSNAAFYPNCHDLVLSSVADVLWFPHDLTPYIAIVASGDAVNSVSDMSSMYDKKRHFHILSDGRVKDICCICLLILTVFYHVHHQPCRAASCLPDPFSLSNYSSINF